MPAPHKGKAMTVCLLLDVITPHVTSVTLFVYTLIDKVVVGSYMGMLRIFSPNVNKTSEGGPADALLLEVQLKNAIIQVEVGKFVS